MISLLKQKVSKHIKDNKILYSLLFAAYLVGSLAGGIAARMSTDTTERLLEDVTIFFSAYSLVGADGLAIFTQSALNNIQVVFFIFLCGFFVLTTPLIFLRIGFLGFRLGFSTVFFISAYGAGGVMLAALMVWLPNLVFLIGVFHFAMLTNRSALRIRKLKSGVYAKPAARKLYLNQVQEFLFITALAVLISGLESFVLPVILRPISGLLL
ncbi:MAG: stage II sporulation protein M [Oscillospiraceae bacterium]|nr:stage II sporulation protein M [Oscillospiraceae bacterium]